MLWLILAVALGSRGVRGHPQPCGVPTRAGASLRLAALLPRAPAARARVLAALATPTPRLPHNLSLELVAVASPTRDPASLARGLCQVLGPPGVVASIAFPEARPELRLLQFLAAATETPVLSVLRREVRAPLGAPVRGERGKPWGRDGKLQSPHFSGREMGRTPVPALPSQEAFSTPRLEQYATLLPGLRQCGKSFQKPHLSLLKGQTALWWPRVPGRHESSPPLRFPCLICLCFSVSVSLVF